MLWRANWLRRLVDSDPPEWATFRKTFSNRFIVGFYGRLVSSLVGCSEWVRVISVGLTSSKTLNKGGVGNRHAPSRPCALRGQQHRHEPAAPSTPRALFANSRFPHWRKRPMPDLRARLLPSGLRHSCFWQVGVAVLQFASGHRKPSRPGNCNDNDCTHWVLLVQSFHFSVFFWFVIGNRSKACFWKTNGFAAI